MKRICLVLCLSLLLVSCSKENPSCYRLYCAIENKREVSEIYPYRSDLQYASFFQRLYYGQYDERLPDEFRHCDDYYVVLSSQHDIWEIHIFHVTSTYDVDSVISMLQARRDRLQQDISSGMYDEETHERVKSASIIAIDHYVILAITDDNVSLERNILDNI